MKISELKIYQVDSFTDQTFKGNPAGVCPLSEWLPHETMQSIAAELNLSETAFYVPGQKTYGLKWFTPLSEVDLCGHATLAAAHIVFSHENYKGKQLRFDSNSGVLNVSHSNLGYHMDFPADAPAPIHISKVKDAVDQEILEAFKGKFDYLLVLKDEDAIRNAIPNLSKIKELKSTGLIITAPGSQKDFVSRAFYPNVGIDEDPVTGSAHTLLTPYWAVRLNKNKLEAAQLSSRGGQLSCSLSSNRIILTGQAITVMEGKIFLNDV